MGKVTSEDRRVYTEKIAEYKKTIEDIQKFETNSLRAPKDDPSAAALENIRLAESNINMVSYYTLMNDLSVALLDVKNEAFLNEGRKCLYKSIIYLEKTVTPLIDAPFSEYSEPLELIEGFQDEKRYFLMQKLGYAIQAVTEAFGENSKWKWSFVELEGRFAVVAKNLLNMKTLVAGMDPRVEGYQERVYHLKLVKKMLTIASDHYRQKYELSTLRLEDFDKAINYLQSLKRILIILNEKDEIETIKKKIDVWKAKLETDEKRQKEQHKGK